MSQQPMFWRLTGVVSVLAASVALTAPAGAVRADAVVVAKGDPMSYVVNTAASAAAMKSAKAAIEGAGAIVMQAWPQIGVTVAHSDSATFKTDVRKGANGDVVESVGATRLEPLEADESPIGVSVSTNKRSPGASESLARAAADPMEDEQWNMGQIKADQAADGSKKVLVGVLDGGIDDSHPDLAQNLDVGNSVGCTHAGVPDQHRSAWSERELGHGTNTAGIIAAARNGEGIVGVAPNTRVAAVRVFDADPGLIYTEYAVCGFMWAATHGFDVTNNSYFVDPWRYMCCKREDEAASREAVARAVAYSVKQGVVSAVGSGNHSDDLANKGDGNITNECLTLPAELPDVVTVSATDEDEQMAGWSNYGYDKIDVSAPGVNVLTTAPIDIFGYREVSGTSIAAPHAAGVLALLKAAHPDAGPKALKQMLTDQADPIPCAKTDENCTGDADYNSHYGHGQVDALEAIGKG